MAYPEFARDAVQAKGFVEDFDIWAAIESVEAERRRKLRLGLPIPPKTESLHEVISKAIEKRVAQ